MIVTLDNNKRYMVTWKHEHPGIGGKLVKRPEYPPVITYGGTKCFIWEIIGDASSSPKEDGFNSLTKKLVATGEARCYKGDCFTKETGRKVSMTKALKEGRHWDNDEVHGDWEILPDNGLFNYDARKAFWDTYLNRKPKKVILEITYNEGDPNQMMSVVMDNMPAWKPTLQEMEFIDSINQFREDKVSDTQNDQKPLINDLNV